MSETQTDQPAPYTDAHIAVATRLSTLQGIDLYNAGEFHAAHDVWEDRWMGEVGPREKLFLQAMIQSAVAFHHLEIGRKQLRDRCINGPRKSFHGSVRMFSCHLIWLTISWSSIAVWRGC